MPVAPHRSVLDSRLTAPARSHITPPCLLDNVVVYAVRAAASRLIPVFKASGPGRSLFEQVGASDDIVDRAAADHRAPSVRPVVCELEDLVPVQRQVPADGIVFVVRPDLWEQVDLGLRVIRTVQVRLLELVFAELDGQRLSPARRSGLGVFYRDTEFTSRCINENVAS